MKTYTHKELEAMAAQGTSRSNWQRFHQVSEAELDEAAAQEKKEFGFDSDSYDHAVVVLPVEWPPL